MAVRVSAKFLIKICVLLHPFPQWGKIAFEVFFAVIQFKIISGLFETINFKADVISENLINHCLRNFPSLCSKKNENLFGKQSECPIPVMGGTNTFGYHRLDLL